MFNDAHQSGCCSVKFEGSRFAAFVYDCYMSWKRVREAFLLQIAAAACLAAPGTAQHHHQEDGSQSMLRWGARGVGVLTHASPAILGRDLTEAYLTQPSVTAMGSAAGGRLSFTGMLNLEGLTLKRGELNHGGWGEGYVDRRHPHTYLHEAVIALKESVAGTQVSLSAGRGFAPFGTDDPMVRPFVKYPVNHHLSQILERYVVTGALRHGPLMLEAGAFNGNEPTSPRDLGGLKRFGDSWSGRATLMPLTGVEVQASVAKVASPELPSGGGIDQKKRSFSARADLPMGGARVYGLLETARTSDRQGEVEVVAFNSVLVESSVGGQNWSVSARYENSTRPEEERRQNLFRSVRPSTDNSILGTSRWRIWTVAVARGFEGRLGTVAPFVEASRAFAKANERFAVYTPEDLYGSDHIWNLSAGIRLNAGMQHHRMGRYGVAVD